MAHLRRLSQSIVAFDIGFGLVDEHQSLWRVDSRSARVSRSIFLTISAVGIGSGHMSGLCVRRMTAGLDEVRKMKG